VRERDKDQLPALASKLTNLGFKLVATKGTAAILKASGVDVDMVNKVKEGRPHIVDMIKSDKINLIINTTEGRQAISDSSTIRSSAEQHRVYYTTTMAGGSAVCEALEFGGDIKVRNLQTLHKGIS
jgi:carbamoyl-phosphate synthase large subunit